MRRPLRNNRARLALACLALAACTPDPGKSVPITDLWTNTTLDREYVAVTGVLRVNTGIAGRTSCTNNYCTLHLEVPDAAWKPPSGSNNSIRIEVHESTHENAMAPLPDKYTEADSKVTGTGGTVFHHGDKVKVSGKLKCEKDLMPCSMYAERFDAT